MKEIFPRWLVEKQKEKEFEAYKKQQARQFEQELEFEF